MSVLFERNGSYGKAALKQSAALHFKIPIWD